MEIRDCSKRSQYKNIKCALSQQSIKIKAGSQIDVNILGYKFSFVQIGEPFVYNTTFILFGSLVTAVGIFLNNELMCWCAMIITFAFSLFFLEISCEIYHIRKKKLINKS